jgi:hypothetical protein
MSLPSARKILRASAATARKPSGYRRHEKLPSPITTSQEDLGTGSAHQSAQTTARLRGRFRGQTAWTMGNELSAAISDAPGGHLIPAICGVTPSSTARVRRAGCRPAQAATAPSMYAMSALVGSSGGPSAP